MALLETLFDNFNDNSRDAKWSTNANGSTTVAETNQEVEVAFPASATSASDADFHSTTTYDFRASYAKVEVKAVPSSSTNAVAHLTVQKDGNNFVRIAKQGTDLNFVTRDNGGYSTATTTYSPTAHRWWRIRHNGSGTVFFDVSPDGASWSALVQASGFTQTFDTDYAFIGAYCFQNESNPGGATFDNFNMRPINMTAQFSGDSIFSAHSKATVHDVASFSGDAVLSAFTRLSSLASQIQPKTFEYKVFDSSGNYIGKWDDVVSDFSFSQEINTAGASVQVELARTIDTPKPDVFTLDTEAGEDFITEDSITLQSDFKNPNRVGPGTDVAVDNIVEVWVYYGTFDTLTDDLSVGITTDDGDLITLGAGAPNGTRIYQGQIEYYEVNFGDNDSVTVLINPFGIQLDNYVPKTGEVTTVPYLSTDPATMLTGAITNVRAQGSIVNYTSASIILTGNIASYTFRLNTLLEVIDEVIAMSPSNWFWYFDCAENNIYLQPQPSMTAHTFVLGEHILAMTLKETKENMVNLAYFTGGDTGGGVVLYRKYSNASSITSHGQRLERQTDQRVTLYDSADLIENANIAEHKDTKYSGTVTISSTAYDIESIKLGQLVGFSNFGNTIDTIQLLVVALDYGPDAVTLTLQTLAPEESKRLEEIKRNLKTQEQLDTPSTPA